MAVVEFARNVLQWKDAQSTEFDKTTTHPMVLCVCVCAYVCACVHVHVHVCVCMCVCVHVCIFVS